MWLLPGELLDNLVDGDHAGETDDEAHHAVVGELEHELAIHDGYTSVDSGEFPLFITDEKWSSLNTCSGMRTSVVEVLGGDATHAHQQVLIGPVEVDGLTRARRVAGGTSGVGLVHVILLIT